MSHCTYISEKVSRIRWRPCTLSEPNSFVTGSWDNQVNNIRLWELRSQFEDFEELEDDINPCEIKVLPFGSNITQLKFINSDLLVASTSSGCVYLFKITSNESYSLDIEQETHWKNLHYLSTGYPSSCTSFALYDSDIASIGQDGRICLLSVNTKQPTRIINKADSCTTECVEFLRYNELLTANNRGQLKIWDLRSNSNCAQQSFVLRSDMILTPTCLAYHPTQRHIVVAADDLGSLTVWDLRQNTYPLNVFKQHADAIGEVAFHPDRPDQLFTCAGGDIFQWAGIRQGIVSDVSLWYTQAGGLNKYDIFRLMPELHVPINSIDVVRDKMLCGAENEAMYVIENVNVYSSYDNVIIS